MVYIYFGNLTGIHVYRMYEIENCVKFNLAKINGNYMDTSNLALGTNKRVLITQMSREGLSKNYDLIMIKVTL